VLTEEDLEFNRVAPDLGCALAYRGVAVRTRDTGARFETTPFGFADHVPLTVNVSRSGRRRVVHIGGELDVASRHLVRDACAAGRRKSVVVEMADMTFMDCSGYGALVAARRILQQHGGSLTLRNPAGQPAEFLTMLTRLEARN
jgi:anti-anti-sigma factor